MALTIADAFKLAYEYYEKGKSTKSLESSQVAQDSNKENASQPKSSVTNGQVDIYATPVKTTASSDAPVIQVTSDSISAAVEESGRKMNTLVIYNLILLGRSQVSFL